MPAHRGPRWPTSNGPGRWGRGAGAAARGLPVAGFLTCALVVAGVIGRPAGTGISRLALAPAQAPSAAPALAMSSSWYCAGATSPGGVAPGDLLLENAGPRVK